MAADLKLVITKFYPDRLTTQLVEPMTNLGNGIARRAQRIVPKRTYALHDTIKTETEQVGDSVVTTVGAGGGDVSYALAVENGTSRMAAQPYLRPAMLQSNAGDFGMSSGPDEHGRKEYTTYTNAKGESRTVTKKQAAAYEAQKRGGAARKARGKGGA